MRAVIILLCITALLLASLACDWQPVDPSPTGWSAEDAIKATADYGAEQWHAQLTEIATTPEP